MPRDLKLGRVGGGSPGFSVCIVCLEYLGKEVDILPQCGCPGALEFGVFLGNVKGNVFCLRHPITTGIAEMASGSGFMENPKEVKIGDQEHGMPVFWVSGPAPEESCLKRGSD